MKLIYPDNIYSVTATEEDASYPDDNVLTAYPEEVWKATSEDARLSVYVLQGAGYTLENVDCIGIFNTNAEEIEVEVVDLFAANLWGPVTYDLTSSTEVYGLINNVSDIKGKNLFVQFTEQASSVIIRLDMEAATGETLECGIVRAGLAKTFQTFDYGLIHSMKDKSIRLEFNRGGEYYKFIKTQDIFSGQFMDDRNPDIHRMNLIAKQIGREPHAWQLTDINGTNWAFFGHIAIDQIATSHNYYSHSTVKLVLEEAV